jgi:hypothetical protein
MISADLWRQLRIALTVPGGSAKLRCLTPQISFCECTDSRPMVTHWFALDESWPVFAFAAYNRSICAPQSYALGKQRHDAQHQISPIPL